MISWYFCDWGACVFVVVWLCFCGGAVVFLWWCGCVFGAVWLVFVAARLCFCGGVVILWRWYFCWEKCWKIELWKKRCKKYIA